MRNYYCYVIIFMVAIIGSASMLQAKADVTRHDPGQFIGEKNRPQKVAYLTFDDGPSKYTEELLTILREKEAPAIFFVTGESIDNMANAKELLKAMLDEQHHIALHSMTHDREQLYYRKNSSEIFVKEMLDLKQLIADMTNGYETNLCRAPYGKNGNFRDDHWRAVEEAGLYCVDWHIDSVDWAKKDAWQIYEEVTKAIKAKEFPDEVVILFHEKKLTAQALPQIIDFLKEQGYSFVPYIEGEKFNLPN